MNSPADDKQKPTTPRVLGAWQPVPAAEPDRNTQPDKAPHFGAALVDAVLDADWPTRIILGVVMTAALAVGTWSVYTLLTDLFHAPRLVAILGCGMFDGAAFFFARLSQRYATTTDSGLGPRSAMLAMICTSAWVNWQHAALKHWGTVGGVVLAAAPVIAELSFEMWHRYEHREALRALGRVAETLPVLGKWAWLTHPFRARKVIDAHIRAGLTETEAVAERRHELADARARSIIAAPAGETVDRTAGPADAAASDRSGTQERTADRGPADRPVQRTTAEPVQVDREERTANVDRPTQPDRTADSGPVQPKAAPTARTTSVRTAGPDRTDTELALNDTERAAIDILRSADRSISKRSIADVVRNELGRSIGSDRAAEIARHFRNLHAA